MERVTRVASLSQHFAYVYTDPGAPTIIHCASA